MAESKTVADLIDATDRAIEETDLQSEPRSIMQALAGTLKDSLEELVDQHPQGWADRERVYFRFRLELRAFLGSQGATETGRGAWFGNSGERDA